MDREYDTAYCLAPRLALKWLHRFYTVTTTNDYGYLLQTPILMASAKSSPVSVRLLDLLYAPFLELERQNKNAPYVALASC